MSDWLTRALDHVTGRDPLPGPPTSYLAMLADMTRRSPNSGLLLGVHTEEQARERVREMCTSLARVLLGDIPRHDPGDPHDDARTLRTIAAVLDPMATDRDIVARCRARLAHLADEADTADRSR